MLQVLGFEFYNINNNLIDTKLGGKVLNEIKYINCDNKLKELDKCNFKIACDVKNVLYGEKNDATYIYGKQKGATNKIIEQLEKGVINFSKVVNSYFNKEFHNIEGVGAGGGIGYSFLTF